MQRPKDTTRAKLVLRKGHEQTTINEHEPPKPSKLKIDVTRCIPIGTKTITPIRYPKVGTAVEISDDDTMSAWRTHEETSGGLQCYQQLESRLPYQNSEEQHMKHPQTTKALEYLNKLKTYNGFTNSPKQDQAQP
jgi:hypothetical protein